MDPWSEHQQALRAQELNNLRYHWGEAYEISWGSGVWRAVRMDNRVSLVATAPEELRELMISDYASHPVPRDIAPGAGS